ncbi:MAG: NRDE family protein [Bacteroidetes bacterium]|nr:NRDE family protein [Bacteroidota bacterium]
MCLIVLAYRVHPRYPLLFAANRDEFHDRPAAPARFWADAPDLLAGRDLRAGGTWMGITRSGRFAALTNYRDLHRPRKQGPSRGLLVRQALEGDFDPGATSAYEGFNLLYGSVDTLRYHTNEQPTDVPLTPGVHGLSNHFLDTPWPKVEHAKQGVQDLLAAPDERLVPGLFALLANDAVAPDDRLPDTGLPLDLERAISSIFIRTDGYGTRCSSVVLVDVGGRVYFEERTWPAGTRVVEAFELRPENAR